MASRAALAGKTIVLGVTGSIAAFKAVALASELVKAGAVVEVILTESALRFVTPLSFQALTHRPVVTDLFDAGPDPDLGHVGLGHRADALVVAPATADAIARLALGLAGDALGTTALATRAPMLVAPAMEPHMFAHPATQANLRALRDRGAIVLGPDSGRLASGHSGPGRMVEPEAIVAALARRFASRDDLAGRRVVVSAGGTREPIDPVRYIGNRSSGKMGYAIAEAARARGAEVTLVSGPSALTPPPGVAFVPVESAAAMQAALEAAVKGADLLVMAAAVSDYRVASPAAHKLKKGGDAPLALTLVPNPDLLAGLDAPGLTKVGFAAETEDLVANARKKLVSKRAHLIVANDVTAAGSGFDTDTNQAVLVMADGQAALPLLTKRELADRILDAAIAIAGGVRA